MLVEIYWSDLTEEKQADLLEMGFNDANIIDDIFPLASFYHEEETE